MADTAKVITREKVSSAQAASAQAAASAVVEQNKMAAGVSTGVERARSVCHSELWKATKQCERLSARARQCLLHEHTDPRPPSVLEARRCRAAREACAKHRVLCARVLSKAACDAARGACSMA